MKSTLPFLSLLLFFTSCQTYQYMSMTGVNISYDSTYKFVTENDTLALSYDFKGYNGPVKLSIYNKTDKPIYVDWKKSALIIGDKAYSYYSPNQTISGSAESTGINWDNGISSQSGSFSGQIKVQDGVDFIPPKSWRERSSAYLVTGLLNGFNHDLMQKQFPDGDKTMPRLKTIDFDQSSSPYRLRSYLTFYTDDKDPERFKLEHLFYVSKIQEGIAGPLNLGNYLERGDRFYTSELNGFGKTAGVVGVVGVLSAAAAVK